MIREREKETQSVSIISVYDVLWLIEQAYSLVYRTHLLFLSRKSLKETQKFEGDEIVCVWERRGIFLVWWIFGSILGCDKPIHPCVCFDKYINVGKRKLQVGPIDLALFKIYIFWFPLFVIKNFNTDLDYPWFHIVNSIFLCVYDALSMGLYITCCDIKATKKLL